MPAQPVTSSTLRPHIEACGYTGDRLKPDYSFGAGSIALAGFISKPWDARSACLAVVDATTDTLLSAQRCIEFGAPTALVCRGDSLDWWQLTISGPRNPQPVRASELEGFFRSHGEQLRPENIYAAKLRRPVGTGVQMEFVDVGLLPALERKAGEALNRLVTQAIRSFMDDLGDKVRTQEEGVYKSVFWMLAAKLLREKGVRGFRTLDLHDVDSVFEVVGRHYKDARDYPPGGKAWLPALSRVASSIAGWGSLGNVSAESLAYLYETSMIDGHRTTRRKKEMVPDVRKTLGIHSTPSILVDHILSQLWPLVDTDKLPDQRVYEAACGHAAFLTGAMRDIRNWSGMIDGADRHSYLRDRVRGTEIDTFAVEIAKLSLTLADVPHGNTWDIDQGDMFKPGVLRDAAKWATMVLSNPPYEDFKKTNANRYLKSIEPVRAQTKAVEMLMRVVPNLSPGSVFGFVLPQGTLYDREAKQLRSYLLESCEVAEISLFEDKLFSIADQEACILLGRRHDGQRGVASVLYRRVRNRDMDAFKSTLHFSREDRLDPAELGRGKNRSLFEPDLRKVWTHFELEGMPKLSAKFTVSKGYEFFKEAALRASGHLAPSRRKGWIPVALRADTHDPIWEEPITGYLDFSPKTYRAKGGGPVPGPDEVIINHSGPRAPWRFRAVINRKKAAVGRAFLVFRHNAANDYSLTTLWAVLNSPIANAYAYSWSGKRHTLAMQWLEMPLPVPTQDQQMAIDAAAAAYLKAAVPPQEFTLTQPDEVSIRQALLELDAAVLRLYSLPPALERELLSIFDGVERPRVGCMFRGYPPAWSSQPMESLEALFAEIEEYSVQVGDFDDSREAIYERMEDD